MTKAEAQYKAHYWAMKTKTFDDPRPSRGANIVASNGVIITDSEIKVQAASRPEPYTIAKGEDGKYHCECQDHQNGHRCKHLWAWWIATH